MNGWDVTIDRVIDGDTVRLWRYQVVAEFDGLKLTASDTAPVPVRLIHVDTPERGENGWAQARADLTDWLIAHEDAGVTLHDAGRDNFGRILGDLRSPDGDTASLHLIRDKHWPTWGETRP